MTITPDNVLNLPMKDNGAGAKTVREYLCKLLLAVWTEGEEFSGKRAFGDSGWEVDLEIPLIQAGLIKGSIDYDGYVHGVDWKAASKIISGAIRWMCEERVIQDYFLTMSDGQ